MTQLVVIDNEVARDNAIKLLVEAPIGTRMELKASKRTLDQNSHLWALLTEVSQQITLNGAVLDPTEWKLVFLSSLSREMHVIRGLSGEPVNLGRSSSKLDKQTFADLLEVIYAYGAEAGVVFKDPRPSTPIEAYEQVPA